MIEFSSEKRSRDPYALSNFRPHEYPQEVAQPRHIVSSSLLREVEPYKYYITMRRRVHIRAPAYGDTCDNRWHQAVKSSRSPHPPRRTGVIKTYSRRWDLCVDSANNTHRRRVQYPLPTVETSRTLRFNSVVREITRSRRMAKMIGRHRFEGETT